MITLVANCAADLLAQLSAIDIRVASRAERRTTEQCERWSICRFLSSYAETELIRYPMRIEKRERPDFLLTLPSTAIGIEVTEVVPPDWARANARRETLDSDDLIFLHRFRPGELRRSSQEIDAIACSIDPGDGWAGDAPEKEWADAMLYFPSQKAKKLAKPGYERFAANWLLIYDNWPLPAVEDAKAATYFVQRLSTLDAPLPFDRVFIECEHFIWQFEANACAEQPIT